MTVSEPGCAGLIPGFLSVCAGTDGEVALAIGSVFVLAPSVQGRPRPLFEWLCSPYVSLLTGGAARFLKP